MMGDECSDFVAVPEGDPLLTNFDKVLVCCRAGDLVLWDSRTAHCNSPPLETPTTGENELLRLVCYVCMTPYDWATRQVIERRIQAFIHNESTSHCEFKMW